MNVTPWLTNAMRGEDDPLSTRQWRDLEVAAAQDGRVDAAEVRFLDGLELSATAESQRDAFLDGAAQGGPSNPEIDAMRRRDPAFDAKVAAIKAHAKPGDLLFWHSSEDGLLMDTIRASWGQIMHVSVVLENGLIMDGNWPEGVTISTPEAAVAKSMRRFNGTGFVVSRPAVPLSDAQRSALTANAYALQGRRFGLVGDIGSSSGSGSCSRDVWDLFKRVGIDLAPRDQRFLKSTIIPADLLQPGVVHVRDDGTTSAQMPEFYTSELSRLPRLHLLALDRTIGRIPVVMRFLDWVTKPVVTFLSLAIRQREVRSLA